MTAELPALIERISQLFQTRQFGLAKEACERVIAIQPKNDVANHGLAVVAFSEGDYRMAVKYASIAVEVAPRNYPYMDLLTQAYSRLGKVSDAVACCNKAISNDPSNARGYTRLGNLLREQGKLAGASAAYQRGLQFNPANTELKFYLALTLHDMKCYDDAIGYLRDVLAEQPDHAVSLNNMGNALIALGRDQEAIGFFEKSIASDPKQSFPLNNLGNALRNQGMIDAALANYRRALDVDHGNDVAMANILLTLNYKYGVSQEDIYKESTKFEERLKSHSIRPAPPFANSKDAERILRIGYISSDFRMHSVAYFTHLLMQTHDRRNVSVYCYGNVLHPDQRTEQFRTRADHWLSIVGMGEDAVAERIREDQIDILVDLAGHTQGNCLGVFARRAAPVQVTWLGYPNTTGLKCIDYRLTDAVVDPVGEADTYHSEKLFRLKHGFLCYQPDGRIPDISPPPSVRNGYVSFGSFNNLAKISPETARLWAHILARVPDSRLVLKSKSLAEENTRARFFRMFEELGIANSRLELIGWLPDRAEHMDAYSTIDISLDPFPYNGTTTSCEALWMGVPFITLTGDRHANRVGTSILHHAGLPEFAAATPDAYVEIAASLAADSDRLKVLRAELRERVRQSDLINCQQFSDTLEDAYRKMWSAWCAT